MNILSKRNLSIIAASSALIGSLAFAGTALAANSAGGWMIHSGVNMARPAAVGTVASISGDILTVNAMSWQRGSSSTQTAATTYSVDATNATVIKNGVASSVSAVAVGDTVIVFGTVSGTNITATTIRDGMMMGHNGRGQVRGGKPNMGMASQTPPMITGNGEPVIGGNVTAISGDTVTVTNKSSVIYTVDVTNATITKPGVTGATISNVSVGDSVIVQGTINGTSVTASSMIDNGMSPSTSSTNSVPAKRGILGSIGSFFAHLFGF